MAEYNPADHSVEEVRTYIRRHKDKQEAVLAAERQGKNRRSLLSDFGPAPAKAPPKTDSNTPSWPGQPGMAP